MAGDYVYYRKINADKSTDAVILAATDYSSATALVTPKNSNTTLYIQRVAIGISTYAAKTWTFQDGAGTPVVFDVTSIAAAAEAHKSESGTIVLDFGPKGLACTKGKSFDIKMSAAGAAGVIHIEAYEKLTGAVALGDLAGGNTTN